MRGVILGSGSERRKELLERLGVDFEVEPSGFKEDLVDYRGDARELVEELALQKALRVKEKKGGGLIIGADTIVELEGEIIGKPENKKEARETLEKLQGKEHKVVTGVCVLDGLSGEREVVSEESFVKFREIGEKEREKYIGSGVWKGKAGGYAIQEEAGRFVLELRGSFSNVVGFPLERVRELLERFGVKVGKRGEIKELEYKIREES